MTDSTLDLVVNPASGWSRGSRLTDLQRRLTASGTDVEIHEPASRGHAAELLQHLAAASRPTAVVGGDGTVHLAVDAFTGCSTPLGIIAGGTGNDFARELGLDRSSDTEVHLARLAGPTLDVDVLEIRSPAMSGGPRRVATVATVGFSVDVNERAERMRFVRGSSRYTLATVLEAPRLQAREIEVTIDGHGSAHQAVLVAIANTGAFGGGMRIAPDADPTDGRADVVVIGEVGRLELLRLLPRAFSGKHVEHPAVSVHRGAHIELRSDSPLRLRGDGEFVAELPVEIGVLPGALRLLGASRPQR